MNNTLESAVGLSAAIQSIQEELYEGITQIWEGDIDGYGKVYKNIENSSDDIPKYSKSAKIFVPEWYNSTKSDYEDVYYNDSKSCVFCFLVGDKDTMLDEVLYQSKVKVVFMLDLSKIYKISFAQKLVNSFKERCRFVESEQCLLDYLIQFYPLNTKVITERLDSNAQRDVVSLLRNINGDYEITGIEKNIDIIFNEYTTSGMKFNDLQPLHAFAVTLDLNYYLTDKCT